MRSIFSRENGDFHWIEGKEREGASFGDETTDEDCEIEKERTETGNVSWICLCYSSLPSNY